MERRRDDDVLATILDTARGDPRVRAVVLSGSRADPAAPPDDLRDFDVVYVVTDVAALRDERGWLGAFGETAIVQTPDAMGGTPAREDMQQECVTRCAFRAATGVYVIETEHDGDEHVHEFKENVPGSRWKDYFQCLWDKDLWDCDENGNLVLVIPNEAACAQRDECHQLLDINKEYNWHAEAEACYGDGDEHVWDCWGYYCWD